MDDQGKKQVALLCDQSPTYAAGYAAGIEIGREAGMREAAKVADVEFDLMEQAGKAHPENSVSRDMCFARAITAEFIRLAILSAIGGAGNERVDEAAAQMRDPP